MANPLIVALDVPTVEQAASLAKQIGDAAGAFKIGLEQWSGAGPDAIRAIDGRVFLDLKLHDIPATVERAVRNLASLEPFMLTIHTLGGANMMRAAVAAKPEGTMLLGVSILTSLDDRDLFELGLPPAGEAVPALASLAHEAGLDGIVCAPTELEAVRQIVPPPFVVVTPGVRPDGTSTDDQARTTTPAAAISAGADYLVVGRPVTRAADPRAAAHAILESLESQ